MNLKMIEGALKSPKTPAHLKKALLKKYGSQLKGFREYSALASTMTPNPKKRANIDHLDGVELDADQSNELDIMGGQFKRKKKKPKPRSPYDSIGEVYAGNPQFSKADRIEYIRDKYKYFLKKAKKAKSSESYMENMFYARHYYRILQELGGV